MTNPSPIWHMNPRECPHENDHVCPTCDFDGYYTHTYPDCPFLDEFEDAYPSHEEEDF